ncbi:hypothetical protein B0H14DRAFT_2627713 [Mycena olivaceomarginata]|nr:hypothetical protein B0H14DRAFT_2627713 [Mycena olivaceomarginata]
MVKCTGSYRIGWAHKIKLELPEALDETKVRRRKEEHNLGRLQSSVDSVSDGDDSKESKVAQDDKNLVSREHVGRTSSKSNPGPKNAYAVEYCLEEKRDKPNTTFPVSKYPYPPAYTLPWPSLQYISPSPSSTTPPHPLLPAHGPPQWAQRIIGASGLGGGTPGPVVVALASAGEVVCEGDELVVREGRPRHKDTEMRPRLCVVHAVVLTHLPIPLPFPFACPFPRILAKLAFSAPAFLQIYARTSVFSQQSLHTQFHTTSDTPDPQDPRHLWKNPWAEGRGRCRGECAAVHAVMSAMTWKWTQRREQYSHKRGKEGRRARWLQAGRMYGGSVPKQREQHGDERRRAAWETSSPVGKCGESGEGEGSEVAVCRRRKGAVHACASRAQVRERAVGGLLTWKRARVEGAVWEWGDT